MEWNERTPLLTQPSCSINGTGRTDNDANDSDAIASHSYRSNESDVHVTHSAHGTTDYTESMTLGTHRVLSAKYQSLDYDNCENDLYLEEERAKGPGGGWMIGVLRWIIMAFIGVLTGLIASFIDIAIHELSGLKYSILKKNFDKCFLSGCLTEPLLFWIVCNGIAVGIAAVLVAYIAPVAAGSGIPQIKCFLNGVKIPYVVRLKTLICKVIGVILSVAGGLSIGKEGPMIHSGSVVAAGISQGRLSALGIDLKMFQYFRTDQEKRDFVSAGAAAGVAAAFGAPVGGVLFSLEEGASFWNQSLTWRMFFASMMSTFTLNMVQSYYHGVPWQLSYSGLINFGPFEGLSYSGIEIPVFLCMGALGGIGGGVFNKINYKLSQFRKRFVVKPYLQLMEAVIVAVMSTIVAFILSLCMTDCQTLDTDQNDNSVQVYCGDGEYSSMANMWMQTPEESVKSLFHDPPDTYKPVTLAVFAIFYFVLACWTYGLSVPSGLFIPCLLTGAAWGRLCGYFLVNIPFFNWINPGHFALIGAAAQLGGVVRMTISLTVILIEATGNITFGLPIMLVLMVAKWVGDRFNEGLYDIHIELAGVPILPWEPPLMTSNITAKEVMSHPVVCFQEKENLGYIVDMLKNDPFNGFPVVQLSNESTPGTFGTLKGLILRSQLIVLIKNKAFSNPDDSTQSCTEEISLEHFRSLYPRYPSIEQMHISLHERNSELKLEHYMNPAPYVVSERTSLPRIFKLFRGLGLRHLVVINKFNEVLGIVSRKDVARYTNHHGKGQMGLVELLFTMQE